MCIRDSHKGERTGFKIREAHLRNFYLSARKFQKYMREKGIFREYDNTIYYSFWYNYGVYALALEKKRHPEMKLVTRAHGYDPVSYTHLDVYKRQSKGFVNEPQRCKACRDARKNAAKPEREMYTCLLYTSCHSCGSNREGKRTEVLHCRRSRFSGNARSAVALPGLPAL